jgi:uncharacterized protein
VYDAIRIHPAEIGFDFDGVIADTVEAFIRIACEQYGYCGIRPADITHFSVEQCLNMEEGVVETIFLQILHDSVGSGLLPMPGAIEVLAELTGQSPVTIVTARPQAGPVHHWLQTVLPDPVWPHIRVVAMGDHDDKARHIRDLGLSVFIDDRAETCMHLQQSGIRSIVFSQPWNRNRHDLPAVHSWQEIRTLCF